MMTEEQQKLVAFLEEKIGSLRFAVKQNAFEKIRPELKHELDCAEIALAALTQPAIPALKLPDAQEQVIGVWNSSANEIAVRKLSGIKIVDFAHWHCHCTKEVVIRDISDHPAILNAPHTAPIEPICATGGWPDLLLHPAIIALKNGEIHAPEVLDIFDAMAREIQIHRDYKRWDYAPKCATGGAEWVKCSERMPHSDDLRCLVFCQDRIIRTGFTSYGDWALNGKYYAPDYVSHWMPLPAAPEEK